MLQITSKDWLINQKRIPDEESVEYNAFWDYQRDLCLNGCMVDGVYISDKLYWHLNIWNTEIDYIDQYGRLQQKYSNPLLRDTEWMIFNSVHKAEIGDPGKGSKGLAIGGIRRLAKSVFISSYIAHGATFDENSQNIISGLNAADIKVTSDKIDKGLNNIPEAFRWQRVEDNWKQQVTLGVKKKDGTRIPFSSILIRNLDDGNNQEVIAGTKPRKLVIEEGGKGPFLKGLQAAIPGFTTPYGWTCAPIVIFTGGDMTKFQDAKELFFSPEAFNFLSFPDQDNPTRVHGLFMGAKYRQEAKVDSTLGNFLNKPKDSDLHNFPMKVSDEELAFKITDEDLEKRRKSGDKLAYQKERMYFPKKVDDIFLNTNVNMFNVEAAKSQQNKLKTFGFKGFPVEMVQTSEGISTKPSLKEVITEWPLKTQSPDAPIMILEHPMQNPPKFLYVAGQDPIKHEGQAAYSDSLFATYIIKRMHSIVGEEFQDMIVAYYVTRPDNKEYAYEQARLLLKYYNAYSLCENDELSFIEYMKGKNEAEIYLAPQPRFQQSLVNNSKLDRKFGVSRASPKIQKFMNGLLKSYMEEVIDRELSEDGSIIKETLGINRILDYALLEEIIGFYEGANCDRIVALECALALCNELDPLYGAVGSTQEDARFKAIYSKERKPKLFSQTITKNKRSKWL